MHKYDATACFELCSFKCFEHKGKKTLTAYKVHFQCQEVEMGRFCVKVLCGSLFTLPIFDNIDKNENSFSTSTGRLNLLLDSSLIIEVLTVGPLWTRPYLQAFVVVYVRWWKFGFHYTRVAQNEWVWRSLGVWLLWYGALGDALETLLLQSLQHRTVDALRHRHHESFSGQFTCGGTSHIHIKSKWLYKSGVWALCAITGNYSREMCYILKLNN